MEERENTEVIIRNYYHDGSSFDFTTRLSSIKDAIKKRIEEIKLAEKYDIETDSIDALPDIISDLHIVKDTLRGHFDILVIFERADEKADEKFPYLDALFDGGR